MKFANFIPSQPAQPVPLMTFESIAFQLNDDFGSKIEEIVDEYLKLIRENTPAKVIEANKELKDRMSRVVQQRLGLKIYLVTNSVDAVVYPNVYVQHSSVVRAKLREYYDNDMYSSGLTLMSSNEDGKILGTVDTQKARVTGWLSEQPVPMMINFIRLGSYGIKTSKEITAIILHELGHVFEGAAMATRVNSTNQILADAVKHSQDKGRKTVEFVYRELSSIDPKLEKDTVEGLVSGNPVVMGVSAFRLIQGTVRSLSGSETYDQTSYESLSDSFAVRFGYAEPLATGLNRLYSHPSRMAMFYMNQILFVYMAISTVMSVHRLITAVMKKGMVNLTHRALMAVVVALIQKLVLLSALVNSQRVTKEDMAYDDAKDRINRIRQNVIEQLKDPSIDNNTKLAALGQLAVIHDTMENIKEPPKVFQILLNKIFPADGRAASSIEAQKEMEKLIANDIFIQAEKLRITS